MYDENRNAMQNKEEYDKSVYLFQLKFVETKLLEIINTIQSHSLNTIIILFSDHGCGGEINWKSQK